MSHIRTGYRYKITLLFSLAICALDARADGGIIESFAKVEPELYRELVEVRKILHDEFLSGRELRVVGKVGTLEGAIVFASEFRRSNVLSGWASVLQQPLLGIRPLSADAEALITSWSDKPNDIPMFAWLKDTGEYLIAVGEPTDVRDPFCGQLSSIVNELLVKQAKPRTAREEYRLRVADCVNQPERFIGVFEILDGYAQAIVGEDHYYQLELSYRSEADFAYGSFFGLSGLDTRYLIDMGFETKAELDVLFDDLYAIESKQAQWDDIWAFMFQIHEHGTYEAALLATRAAVERENEEQRIIDAERSRDSPYYALITCQFQSNTMPLAACFTGDTATEITLQTTENSMTVQYFNFGSIGSFSSNQDSLRITLPNSFYIAVQNASDTLAVHLEIKRTGDDSLVYSEHQGRLFGVASHRQ